MKIRAVLLLVTATVFGCAIPQRARIDGEKRVDCAKKASFDLDCPDAQLSFQCLAEGPVSHGGWSGMTACISWGVRGCGKKAIYVLTDLGWINNGGTQPSAN